MGGKKSAPGSLKNSHLILEHVTCVGIWVGFVIPNFFTPVDHFLTNTRVIFSSWSQQTSNNYYKYGCYGGLGGTYSKVRVSRYRNNPKMLNSYMFIMIFGPFSKYQIWNEFIYIIKNMWSILSESLTFILNARTTYGRGN